MQKIFKIFVFLAVLVSCAYNKSLDEVQKNVQVTVAELPVIDNIEMIVTVPETFSHGKSPDICYYGRVFVVYGTSLTSEKAISLYITKLQESGWEIIRDDPESGILDLTHGDKELISIETIIGPIVTSSEAYKQAKKDYDIEFTIIVEYILPNVEPCN